MLTLKNLLSRLWTRFDIWVGFEQPKYNTNSPQSNDIYWLLFFIYCILLIPGILFNIRFLIIYSVLSILLIVFCMLYQCNLIDKFKFLDNIFSQLSMSLKLTSPLICFVPIEYGIIIRLLSFNILTKYFTGNIGVGKFFISLFSSSISFLFNYLPSWSIQDYIRINVNDSWLNKIMNSTPPPSPTEATSLQTSAQPPVSGEVSALPPVSVQSAIPLLVDSPIVALNANAAYTLMLQQRPDYIAEVAGRALSKMGSQRLIELPRAGSNHHELFSYEEYAAVKFFMKDSWDERYSERGGRKYGAWQSHEQVGPNNTLKIYGPLTYHCLFYRDFKNNLIRYRQYHGL